MLLFNKYLFMIYLVIAGLFFVGLVLRILHLYPGKKEPFILDFFTVVIALLFASLAEIFKISNMRFVLLLTSSLIFLPHIMYIISNKTI